MLIKMRMWSSYPKHSVMCDNFCKLLRNYVGLCAKQIFMKFYSLRVVAKALLFYSLCVVAVSVSEMFFPLLIRIVVGCMEC